MRARQEFQKDGRVDRQIATDTKAPEGRKAPDGSKIRRRGRNHAEDRRYAQGQVERPPPTENIAAKPPKHGTSQKTDILGEREERRSGGIELVGDGRQYERGNDGPQVIIRPAEAHDDEELPLIPAHADLLDLKIERTLLAMVTAYVNDVWGGTMDLQHDSELAPSPHIPDRWCLWG